MGWMRSKASRRHKANGVWVIAVIIGAIGKGGLLVLNHPRAVTTNWQAVTAPGQKNRPLRGKSKWLKG